jgi:hypothetical protein
LQADFGVGLSVWGRQCDGAISSKLLLLLSMWPLAARAQQSMPVIGYVNSGTAGANVKNIAAFRAGLTEDGFVEGKNVAIEFRWAENQRRLRKSEQDGKWSFCLTAGTLLPANQERQ